MTKTTSTSVDLSWSSPQLRHLLKMYWLLEPQFSTGTIEQLRKPHSVPPLRPKSLVEKWRDDNIFDEGKCPQLGSTIDDGVHPLWTFQNLITDLPMEEVQGQLLPTCRLATKLIGNDHVLKWFSHVRYASKTFNDKGLAVLQNNPFSRTAEALAKVQYELLRLAENVRFSWFGKLLVPKGAVGAMTCYDVRDVIQMLEENMDVETMPESFYNGPFECFDGKYSIWLDVEYFHQLMRQRYDPNFPPRVARRASFLSALQLVHELAHVWVRHCHPGVTNGSFREPLIRSTDQFPEAGFSWEESLFGARVCPYDDWSDNYLGSQGVCLLADSFDDNECAFYAHIPQAWVDQWFLKSTWASFEELRRAGKFLAPAPRFQVEQFTVHRFCSTRNVIWTCHYHNGLIVERCCRAPNCNACEPGNHMPWPSHPTQVRTMYLEIWKRDKHLAQCAGVYNPANYTHTCLEHLERLMNPLG